MAPVKHTTTQLLQLLLLLLLLLPAFLIGLPPLFKHFGKRKRRKRVQFRNCWIIQVESCIVAAYRLPHDVDDKSVNTAVPQKLN